ncbi:MAG TPA: DUF6097 family protein [Paenibacillus sp.]
MQVVISYKKSYPQAHAFIRQYQLPVEIVENNLHKQIILMENHAGTRFFQQALAKYKRVSTLLMILAIIVLLPTFIVAGLEYLQPELGVGDFLLNFLFEQFTLSMSLVGTVFVVFILLAILRSHYAKALHGKVLNEAWQAITQNVTV